MNREDVEQRLYDEAGRIRVECPERVNSAVRRRIDGEQQRRRRFRPAWPALAAACSAAVVIAFAVVLMPQPGPEAPATGTGRDVPAPDALLAAREAELEREWQLLARDLESLRERVSATLETDLES
jgi:hypothetical protein